MNNSQQTTPGAIPTKDPRIIHKVKDLYAYAYGLNHNVNYNPAPNPVSLDAKHVQVLESNLSEWMVTPKADGVRYQLVLGLAGKKGFAVMVDRKMRMFEVTLYAQSEYFQEGSLFDGEIVSLKLPNGKQRQMYLVFDCVCLKGKQFQHQQFMERYHQYVNTFDIGDRDLFDVDVMEWDKIAQEIAATQDKIVSLGNSQGLMFKPKQFRTLINLGAIWRTSKNLQYQTDGLIFTKSTGLITTGQSHNDLKWKEKHTIDLILEGAYSKGQWSFNLFFQDDATITESKSKHFSINDRQYFLTLKSNGYLENTCKYYSEKNVGKFKLLAECCCEFDETQPIIWCSVERYRDDKFTSNNFNVIQRTLCNIQENVTIDQLLAMTNKHMYTITH